MQEAMVHLLDDDEFWRLQANSLTVLQTAEDIRTFRLANKLQASVEVSATTYDIVDELVGLTVRQGGEVIGLRQDEMPDGVKVAAIFRYAA